MGLYWALIGPVRWPAYCVLRKGHLSRVVLRMRIARIGPAAVWVARVEVILNRSGIWRGSSPSAGVFLFHPLLYVLGGGE